MRVLRSVAAWSVALGLLACDDATNLAVPKTDAAGGTAAAEHLKARLGIDFNETTPDGRFTLKEGECMGACGDAPVLLVNNHRMCSWMGGAKLDALVDELSAAADRGEGAPRGDGGAK